jgi:hypothetical protein
MDEEHVKVTETTTKSATPNATQRTEQVTTASGGTPSGLVLAERIVYFLVGALGVLLLIRFVLSLLGANLGNMFAEFIFGLSNPFVAPFLNLFNFETALGASRFELETLIAVIVYSLLGWLVVTLLRLPRRSAEA